MSIISVPLVLSVSAAFALKSLEISQQRETFFYGLLFHVRTENHRTYWRLTEQWKEQIRNITA